MAKEEAYRVVGREPKQMTDSQKELAMELYHKAIHKSGFPEKKERVRAVTMGKTFMCSLFTLGFYIPDDSVLVEKPGGLENSGYKHGRALIPGYPLVWPWWSQWVSSYNLGNGEEQWQTMIHGLGFSTCLGGYAHQVSLERKNKKLSLPPSSFGDMYNVRTAYHALFGAFAFGRVNHRNYMQLLWIPIPLGRAED